MTKPNLEQLLLHRAAGVPVPHELAESFDPVAVRDAVEAVPVFFRSLPLVVTRQKDDGGEGEIVREFIASAEVADRAGDIVQIKPSRKELDLRGRKVKPKGMRTGNFLRAGGPLLWAHNRKEDLPPVGEVTKARVGRVTDPESGKTVNAMIERAVVHAENELPIGKAIARLVDSGALRTVSQGFVAEEIDFVGDEKAREAAGLGMFGVYFRQIDQVELSLTPTPMLPLAVSTGEKSADGNALVARALDQLRRKGALTQAEVDDVMPVLVPICGEERAMAKVKSYVDFVGAFERGGDWPFDPPYMLPGDESPAEPVERAAELTEPTEDPVDPSEPAEQPTKDAVELAEGDTALDIFERHIGDAALAGRQIAKLLDVEPGEALAAVKALQERLAKAEEGSPGQVTHGDIELLEEALDQLAGGEERVARAIDRIRGRSGVDLRDAGGSLLRDQLASSIARLAEALPVVLPDQGGSETPSRPDTREARSADDTDELGSLAHLAKDLEAKVSALLGVESPTGS